MNKQYRVKKSNEIEDILKNKKYSGSKYFTLYVKTNSETSHFRYAISVGKKLGNAVVRNLIKRRIRACITNLNIDLNKNVDVLIIAKTIVNKLDYEAIYKDLRYLFRKQNLLQGENND